jgi:hypothetical protein
LTILLILLIVFFFNYNFYPGFCFDELKRIVGMWRTVENMPSLHLELSWSTKNVSVALPIAFLLGRRLKPPICTILSHPSYVCRVGWCRDGDPIDILGGGVSHEIEGCEEGRWGLWPTVTCRISSQFLLQFHALIWFVIVQTFIFIVESS